PDPHDDVGTVPGLDLDVVVDLPDLIDGDLPYPGYDQEQDVFGATDLVIVEQGGIQSAHDGLMGPGTARSGGGTHDGGAGIGKYRLGVPEVDVLGVVVGDDLGDPTGRGGQDLVGLGKAGLEAQITVYLP